MPPKDLKSAKKLYSKLKKEKNISKESAPVSEISEDPETADNKDTNASIGDINEKKETEITSKTLDDGSTSGTVLRNADESTEAITHGVTSQDAVGVDQTQSTALSIGKYDAETDNESADNNQVIRNASEVPVEHSKDTTSPDLNHKTPQEMHKVMIAELKDENETLKQQIKLLENKLLRAENEIAALKLSEGEVSLSPILETPEPNHTTRGRATSFVEAELYSDVDKVTSRTEQMDKWAGYQLDLRQWTTSQGIGRIVTF